MVEVYEAEQNSVFRKSAFSLLESCYFYMGCRQGGIHRGQFLTVYTIFSKLPHKLFPYRLPFHIFSIIFSVLCQSWIEKAWENFKGNMRN